MASWQSRKITDHLFVSKVLRAKSRLFLIVLLSLTLFLAIACDIRIHEELRRSAIKGDVDTVRGLLARGANVNYRHGGWTILMFVAEKGHTEVAKILLENGADPNAKSQDGASALTVSAEKGHVNIIELILTQGANVNARNNHGNTALMYGAEYGHPNVVRVLLDARANVNLKDKDGETALMIAGRKKHTEIIQLLKAAGAKE